MLHNLPPELALHVLTHMSLNQCLSLRLVSTTWNEIIYNLLRSKLVYFIDAQKHGLPQSDEPHNFETSLTNLSEENFDISRVCICNYNLLQEMPNIDGSLRKILSKVTYLTFEGCELSSKFLCFLLNRTSHLKSLRLSVLFDKAIEFKAVQLRPKVFHNLTELNLSHSLGMEDQTFAKLCIEMPHLQVLNCAHSKMVMYPNYMRRYYSRYNDLDACWSAPSTFGFTFNIIRAALTFIAFQLKQIHLGPNILIDNVLELLEFKSLEDIHLHFISKMDLDALELKVHSLPAIKASNKRLHFNNE